MFTMTKSKATFLLSLCSRIPFHFPTDEETIIMAPNMTRTIYKRLKISHASQIQMTDARLPTSRAGNQIKVTPDHRPSLEMDALPTAIYFCVWRRLSAGAKYRPHGTAQLSLNSPIRLVPGNECPGKYHAGKKKSNFQCGSISGAITL